MVRKLRKTKNEETMKDKIVSRFCTSGHDFTSISVSFNSTKVRNFGREPVFLELKKWGPGGRPSKIIVSHPINAINSSAIRS